MKKILLVDDLKTLLITVEAILKKEGYLVFSCTNSIDALDKINAEPFDLMITDAIMPGSASGYSLISTVRTGQKNQDIPIIMLTGKREKSDIEKAVSVGANDYIIKPVDADILISKVRNLIEKNSSQPDFIHAPVNVAATVQTKCDIISVSEIEVTLHTNFQINVGQLYRLSSSFLKDNEIDSINIRITDCRQLENSTHGLFKITGQFVGASDKELGKLRLWIRKRLSEMT